MARPALSSGTGAQPIGAGWPESLKALGKAQLERAEWATALRAGGRLAHSD